MIVAWSIAALVLGYAAAAFYLRKANQYLENSDEPWDRLYHAAEVVISDPSMPREAANFAAAAVVCAGCGCLTRQALFDAAVAKVTRREPAESAIAKVMTADQQDNFSAVVVNAIYYDSLRAPVSGFVLRRLVFPWLGHASRGLAKARKRGVDRLTVSSKDAIGHRDVGKRLLTA